MNTPLFSWKKDNNTFLALHIPIALGKHARTLLSKTERYFLSVLPDGRCEHWETKGVAENDGKTFLYGNWKNLRALPELFESIKDTPDVIPLLASLERTLEYYNKNFVFPPIIPPDYIFVGPAFEIFVPSISLNHALISLIPSANLHAVNSPVYQRLKVSDPFGAIFLLLARLLYTGTINNLLQPPVLENKDLNESINTLVDLAAYKVAPEPKKLLADLKSEMKKARSTPTPVSRSYIIKQEKIYQNRENNTHEKKTKRKTLYVTFGSALLIVLFVILSLPKRDPLPIMPPGLVVQEFYQAANRLDHGYMSRLTKKGAASQFINETVQLFVSTRMQLATEGRVSLVSPEKYTEFNSDNTNMPSPLLVYGISSLNIQEKSRTEKLAVFLASYVKWIPDLSSIEQIDNEEKQNLELPTRENLGYSQIPITEELTLERKSDDRWYITAVSTGS